MSFLKIKGAGVLLSILFNSCPPNLRLPQKKGELKCLGVGGQQVNTSVGKTCTMLPIFFLSQATALHRWRSHILSLGPRRITPPLPLISDEHQRSLLLAHYRGHMHEMFEKKFMPCVIKKAPSIHCSI
jgi:hypothetical protein